MLLGKRYTRIKRKLNAKTLYLEFTRTDGVPIKLSRKLNMIAIVSMSGKVKKRTGVKYAEKFIETLKCKL